MEHLASYIATGVISLSVGLLLTRLRPTSNLRFWTPHRFWFHLEEQGISIGTQALTVNNHGREPASDVEIALTEPPTTFQIFPEVPWKDHLEDDGTYILQFGSVGPKESFTLQILNIQTAASPKWVRSERGPAERMHIEVQRSYPTWFNLLAALLALLGAGFAAYWLINALAFISSAIGIG